MEGIEMSTELDKLAPALAKAQAEIRKAAKNARNPHLRNRYADLESVLDVVRPVAASHGLSFPCFPVCRDGRAGVRWMLLHASGQWMSGEVLHDVGSSKGLKPAQADGVCISYAKRYAASAVFSVSTGDDTDGETRHSTARAVDKRKTHPEAWATFTRAMEEAGIPLEKLDSYLTMCKWVFSDEGRKALS
jgi:hypothetical protein